MGSLTRSTVILAGFVTGSLLLGVLRQGIVAHFFGSSDAYNAFVIAEAIPLLLLHILFGGALAGAVVPAVVDRLRQQGEAEAWRYTLAVGTTLVGSSVLLSGGLAWSAPWLVDALGPGLSPAVRAEAVLLTRVVVAGLPLLVAAALVAAVLNAHDEFFAPGLRNLGSNIPMILVLAMVGASLGAEGLVVGFLCGAAVQLAVQLPRLWRLARPWFAWSRLRPQSQDLQELWRRYAPILVTHLLLQAFTILDRSFSTLADPAGAALFLYAERIVNASRTVIAGSLAVVIFPRLTRSSAAGAASSDLLGRALGVVTLATIPFGATLFLYGDCLVAALFEHGSFSAADNRAVTTALGGLAPGVLFVGVVLLLDRVFIARGRIWTFASLMALGLAVDGLLKLWLVADHGIAGIAWATTAGFGAAALGALCYLRLFTELRFIKTALIDLGSTGCAFGVAFGIMQLCPELPLPYPWSGVAAALLALAGGAGLLHLLDPPAYRLVRSRLRGE